MLITFSRFQMLKKRIPFSYQFLLPEVRRLAAKAPPLQLTELIAAAPGDFSVAYREAVAA
jgi:hypothetical protein